MADGQGGFAVINIEIESDDPSLLTSAYQAVLAAVSRSVAVTKANFSIFGLDCRSDDDDLTSDDYDDDSSLGGIVIPLRPGPNLAPALPGAAL